MYSRDAEDAHGRIADELLNGAPVALEAGPGRLEVASHDEPERLRVEALTERRRPGKGPRALGAALDGYTAESRISACSLSGGVP